MKILFGTDLFYQNFAGSVSFIQYLAKGLIKDGHQVFVIAPSKTFENTISIEDGVTVYGIRSVIIPDVIYPSQFRIPITAGSNKIRTILEEVKPDVVSIQDHFMIGGKIAKESRRLNIPTVGTNHFMPENFIHYLYPPEFAKEFLRKLAWKDFLRVYKKLDVVTTPTKTAAELIKNLGLRNTIIPISNGVDLKRFNPKNNGQTLRTKYNIPPTEPIILFVGRLDKEKEIDELIKAFAETLHKIRSKLIIAGKGTERSKLISLSRKLGLSKDIIFPGFVPHVDLPSLYTAADVFAIASIAELQSIATLEAMASGLPVVAVNAIALPELVHDGENGYLFEKGDTKNLSDKLVKILKDKNLRKKMSKKSLEIIKQHNIEDTVKKYEKIYEKLVKS